MEAYGSAHYWARRFRAMGHEVKLTPPIYVKPYIKRGKNDAADAAAICEAMSRPNMRFVAVKSEDQQAKARPLDREPRVVGLHQGPRTHSAPPGRTYDRRPPAVHRRNKKRLPRGRPHMTH
jgi:hypothetical protein